MKRLGSWLTITLLSVSCTPPQPSDLDSDASVDAAQDHSTPGSDVASDVGMDAVRDVAPPPADAADGDSASAIDVMVLGDAVSTDGASGDAVSADGASGDVVLAETGVDAGPDSRSDAAVDAGVALMGPRPVAPGSAANSMILRPRFRWVLAPGSDGVRADLCRDRALTTGCASFLWHGTDAVPPMNLAAGTWFWRLRALRGAVEGPEVGPVWTFRLGPGGRTGRSTVDMNGDGYSDLLVSAETSSAIHVYFGGASGYPTLPSTSVVGRPHSLRGWAALAGDVNGDGCSDALSSGQVVLGGSAGLTATATSIYDLSSGSYSFTEAIGDINGDGFADVAAGWALYFGRATGLDTAPFRTFPSAMLVSRRPGPAGDVNGDGYADLLVNSAAGSVDVYFGSAAGLPADPSYTIANALGYPAGDINGDGIDDLLIRLSNTAAYPMLGNAMGAGELLGAIPLPDAGHIPVAVGDVNGDGFGDVVAHPRQPSFGSVTLFYGNASGLSRTPVTVYASVVDVGVACGGDVNHDGFADVALGYAPNVRASRAEHGYVNFVRGSASGLLTATAQQLRDIVPLRFGRTVGVTPRGWPMASQGEGLGWMWGSEHRGWGSLGTDYGAALVGVDIEGDGFEEFAASAPSLNSVWVTSVRAILRSVELNGPAGSSFGASLAAFDVNNDGFRDVVVGAPGASSVYVYWGRVTGISLSAPSVLTGVAGSQFGAAVANVGDVNHDGIEDLAVGSPASRQAFVYTGRAMGGPALAATLSGSLGFGRALSFADVNGDRFSDVLVGAPDSDEVSVFHGGASGPSATANAVLRGAGGSQFGSSVIGIGDSNVDGFHDVVVGAPAGSELRLFRGSAAGLNTTMVNSLAGAAGSQLGTSLALRSARDPMWTSHSLVIAGSPGSNQVAQFGVGSGGIQGVCPRGAPDCNGLPTLYYISPPGYSSFGTPLY